MTTDENKKCCAGKGEGASCCKDSRTFVTIAAVIVAVISLIWGASQQGGGTPAAMKAEPAVDASTLITGEDTVVAKVDGEPIRKSDVAMAIRDLGANVPPESIDAILPGFIEQYVNLKLINKAAEKAGVTEQPEVKTQLSNSYNQIIRAAYLNQLFSGQITDEAMKAAYKARYEDQPMPEEVHARHILVDDEATAKELITKLNGGAKFEKLAEEYSKDPSASRGGDLGYFVETEMVPEFGKAAFALGVGKISETPVKSQFGWHVIKVEDKRQRAKPSFEEAKPALEQEARQVILDAKLTELRKDANIEIVGAEEPPVMPGDEDPAAGDPAPADPDAPAAE